MVKTCLHPVLDIGAVLSDTRTIISSGTVCPLLKQVHLHQLLFEGCFITCHIKLEAEQAHPTLKAIVIYEESSIV